MRLQALLRRLNPNIESRSTPREILTPEQAEHDARHPGLTCQTCPRTIAYQEKLLRRPSRFQALRRLL